jgi:hypothetical protein
MTKKNLFQLYREHLCAWKKKSIADQLGVMREISETPLTNSWTNKKPYPNRDMYQGHGK